MNWTLCLSLSLAGPLPAQVPEPAPRGLILQTEAAQPGYTLVAPLRSNETFLVDGAGREVHRWASEFTPGHASELLPNGNLLRAAKVSDNERFHGGGEGGLLEEFTWDGERVWAYRLSSDGMLQHHDFDVLPNGNVLALVWESRTRDEALAAGRRPQSVDEDGLWPDAILELKPVHPDGAEVVWSWHAWDHLVQDQDESLPNYGDPAAHPERIDVNVGAAELEQPETEEQRQERLAEEQRLRALGYIGDGGPGDAGDDTGRDHERSGADWMHTNSVHFNAELDLIAISVRNFSEVFVIDHSTSTSEAAGSEGGRHGHGGDLLWRWGNPENQGLDGERKLFGQHDARWTRDGEQIAISVFNNGRGRPDGDYSSVDLMHLPFDDEDRFVRTAGQPDLPEAPAWSYSAPEGSDFFSSHISGAVQLDDGRFLVCEGSAGRVYQVDRAGAILWEFVNPFEGEAGPGGPPGRGRGGRGPGGRPGGSPPPGEPRPGEPQPGEPQPGGGPPGDDPRGGGADDGPGAGRGGPPRGRRGGRGGPGGPGGPGSATAMFRAVHVPLDHPGLPDDLGPVESESSD